MNMELIMLGTGSAMVTKCYNTCFALRNNNEYFLVDAGGGNGILAQLEKAEINYKNIKVNGLDNVVEVGDTSKLEAVIDGEVHDNVKWKSSNNDNVVVSENGELTAVQNGIASVIGTVYDQSGKNIIGNVDIEFNISLNDIIIFDVIFYALLIIILIKVNF